MASKKKGLGKGLDALLGDAFSSAAKNKQSSAAQQSSDSGRSSLGHEGLATDLQTLDDLKRVSSSGQSSINNENRVLQVPIELCQRGKYQPRRAIDQESLEELASSIKAQGVMQPIILRPLESSTQPNQAKYEIIAGERRWRASQLAGIDTVPAIVKDVPDEAAVAMALIENLQREDLNPMDEAYALVRLQEEFELTHQQIADVVGKSRAAVSNSIRLTSLHQEVKLMLENGDIEMGHARALLSLDSNQQTNAARDVVNRGLTVRQTEALVKHLQQPKAKNLKRQEEQDANIKHLQTNLSEKLGVPVMFKHKSSGAGQLVLKYNSLDELDGILEHIK